MYYGGFLYGEAYNLPVSYRKWFIERLSKELNREGNENAPTKAMHHNTPDVRALQGMARSHVPSRLRRFT
jgi:hypothetical protein